MDLVWCGLLAGFFVLMVGLTIGCDKLMNSR